jgi:hypothetical protein
MKAFFFRKQNPTHLEMFGMPFPVRQRAWKKRRKRVVGEGLEH